MIKEAVDCVKYISRSVSCMLMAVEEIRVVRPAQQFIYLSSTIQLRLLLHSRAKLLFSWSRTVQEGCQVKPMLNAINTKKSTNPLSLLVPPNNCNDRGGSSRYLNTFGAPCLLMKIMMDGWLHIITCVERVLAQQLGVSAQRNENATEKRGEEEQVLLHFCTI